MLFGYSYLFGNLSSLAFYFLTEDFTGNEHLINHFKDLKMNEPRLIKDHEIFMKHEEVKDRNVYVCNVFRNEEN